MVLNICNCEVLWPFVNSLVYVYHAFFSAPPIAKLGIPVLQCRMMVARIDWNVAVTSPRAQTSRGWSTPSCEDIDATDAKYISGRSIAIVLAIFRLVSCYNSAISIYLYIYTYIYTYPHLPFWYILGVKWKKHVTKYNKVGLIVGLGRHSWV